MKKFFGVFFHAVVGILGAGAGSGIAYLGGIGGLKGAALAAAGSAVTSIFSLLSNKPGTVAVPVGGANPLGQSGQRGFARLSVAGLMACPLVLLLAFLPVVGCASLESLFQIAEASGTAAAGALQATDPGTAGDITKVVTAVADVDKLIAAYKAAEATAKPGIAGEIESASTALQADTATLLSAFQVKHPELVTTIEVFVAAVNAALVAGISQIPSSPTTQAVTQHAATATPTVKVASMNKAASVKSEWNKRCQSSLPAAVLK